MFNDDELEFLFEEDEGDTTVLTFKASDRVIAILRERYGDNFEDEISRIITEGIERMLAENAKGYSGEVR